MANSTVDSLLPSQLSPALKLEKGVDAGLYPELHYERRLSPVRAKVRRWLLPVIRSEKALLWKIQSSIRHPFLDWYFTVTSNLGTHTFYLVCLPMLFWFGYAGLGRGLTFVVASGVFFSGFIKDMFCLPRPLSPPIERLTISGNTHLEYGFPSTHTANAISITMYLLAVIFQLEDIEDWQKILCTVVLSVYCFSVVFGRIYCGMHSITDVAGGWIVGLAVWWAQWHWQKDIDEWIWNGSWIVPITIISICIFLIYMFPEPVDDCPCFEDCVAFAGVIMGLIPGCWRYAHSSYSIKDPEPGNVPYDFEVIGVWKTVARVVLGVAILFIWRMIMKKLLYATLPTFYRALNLNIYRKDYLPARDFKNLSISPGRLRTVPSLLNLTLEAPKHSVGPQSTADMYEQLDVAKKKVRRRGNNGNNQNIGDETIDIAGETQMDEKAKQGDIMSFDELEELPLRYDVDVVVKLVVYAGIGWLAVDLIPIFFELCGLGVKINESYTF